MIDYKKIAESIPYYENRGYNRMEVPWAVSQYIANITKPDFKKHTLDNILMHNDKVLVASGEQSYLYLYLKNFMQKGRFQAITPCFRHEKIDYLHSKYFLKNELIVTDEVDENNLQSVINDAYEFFQKYIPVENLNIVKVAENFGVYSYDIKCVFESGPDKEPNMIELGSYGIRECEFLKWIYATGLAEPRLSRVMNLLERNGLS